MFVEWVHCTNRRWRICVEWPKNGACWNWKEGRLCLASWDLQEACFDGCAIGLKARSEEFLKKPWRVCTNDLNILSALRGLTCSNTGNVLKDHVHAECRGIDCKNDERYTFSFTRRVHRAFRKRPMEALTKLFPYARHPLTILMNYVRHVVQILLVYVLLKVISRHLTTLLFVFLPQ